VTKATQEKEAIIIKAEGEAQSAALVGKVSTPYLQPLFVYMAD
jgi:hypothetical protein